MTTKMQIINAALELLGDNGTLASLSVNNKSARSAAATYPIIRDAILAEYPWNFTRVRRSLALVSDTPLFGFQYQYQLPSDLLKIISVDGQPDYTLEGSYLLTNVNTVYIVYQRAMAEGDFPPYFTLLLTYMMAEILAIPVTGDLDMKTIWSRSVATQKQLSMAQDGQQRPAKGLRNDVLIQARLGTRWNTDRVRTPGT